MGADGRMGQLAAEQGCTRASLTPFLSPSVERTFACAAQPSVLSPRLRSRLPNPARLLGGNVRSKKCH
jgi:hypothetical protein